MEGKYAIAKQLHRNVKESHEFKIEGTFKSLWAAQKWCGNHGYSYGSTCVSSPVALMQGDFSIAKWKNLTDFERKTCDGVMISNYFREAAVTILIFEPITVDAP